MVDRWHMHTQFMLNRVNVSDLKRMVEQIKDGVNYQVNDKGNIEEVDLSPIERDLDHLLDRHKRKVKQANNAETVVQNKLDELKDKNVLDSETDIDHKIEVLEQVKGEIDECLV